MTVMGVDQNKLGDVKLKQRAEKYSTELRKLQRQVITICGFATLSDTFHIIPNKLKNIHKAALKAHAWGAI